MKETRIAIEVGRNRDGLALYRYHFINTGENNYMAKAHSYYTKEERKAARLSHKAN